MLSIVISNCSSNSGGCGGGGYDGGILSISTECNQWSSEDAMTRGCGGWWWGIGLSIPLVSSRRMKRNRLTTWNRLSSDSCWPDAGRCISCSRCIGLWQTPIASLWITRDILNQTETQRHSEELKDICKGTSEHSQRNTTTIAEGEERGKVSEDFC